MNPFEECVTLSTSTYMILWSQSECIFGLYDLPSRLTCQYFILPREDTCPGGMEGLVGPSGKLEQRTLNRSAHDCRLFPLRYPAPRTLIKPSKQLNVSLLDEVLTSKVITSITKTNVMFIRIQKMTP